nr:MAG TPA: hypothetical protein [Caudoviricetes sp.]
MKSGHICHHIRHYALTNKIRGYIIWGVTHCYTCDCVPIAGSSPTIRGVTTLRVFFYLGGK